jgi:DNA-binding PadR family transcriptional regulator
MSDLFSAQSDVLILAVLQSGPAHGYAIIDAIKTRSEGRFDLPEGTIYPALHRLERQGFLVSAWTPGERRQRRTYELSGAGREALAARRSEWQHFSIAMSAVIRASP